MIDFLPRDTVERGKTTVSLTSGSGITRDRIIGTEFKITDVDIVDYKSSMIAYAIETQCYLDYDVDEDLEDPSLYFEKAEQHIREIVEYYSCTLNKITISYFGIAFSAEFTCNINGVDYIRTTAYVQIYKRRKGEIDLNQFIYYSIKPDLENNAIELDPDNYTTDDIINHIRSRDYFKQYGRDDMVIELSYYNGSENNMRINENTLSCEYHITVKLDGMKSDGEIIVVITSSLIEIDNINKAFISNYRPSDQINVTDASSQELIKRIKELSIGEDDSDVYISICNMYPVQEGVSLERSGGVFMVLPGGSPSILTVQYKVVK